MSNRKPLIAGNWKLHKTCDEAVETASRLAELVSDVTDVDIMIAPPFTALHPVYGAIKNTPVALGSQNLYWEEKGAFTGEISAEMIHSCGCEYAIIGHSERRVLFDETDETVNMKIRAALGCNLKPVLCVGESENERQEKKTFNVLDKQIEMGLKGFASGDLKHLVIAYEPVWAIGTGNTASPEQVQEVHSHLRSHVEKLFGNELAISTRILYGGSVKPENISQLMGLEDVDGALVGGASLNPEIFANIVRYK